MLNSSIENIVEKLNKQFPGPSVLLHKQVFINFLRAVLSEADATEKIIPSNAEDVDTLRARNVLKVRW